MSTDEFMKQQYLTLREEIREAKARIFRLLVLGVVLIVVAGFMASQFGSVFASASIPFLVVVLILAYIGEQNSITRAGRYLREHVEPHIDGVTGWEHWLEGNRKLREVDRAFAGSFLAIFFLFYVVAAGTAMLSISSEWYDHYWYTGIAYVIGGCWVLFVLGRHWHAATTTSD